LLLPPVYFGWIVFHLYTHAHIYDDANVYEPASKKYTPKNPHDSTSLPLTPYGAASGDTEASVSPEKNEELEEPQLGFRLALALLVVVAVLAALTAEFLVDSMDGLIDSGRVSSEFVTIVLGAVVGNAAGSPLCSRYIKYVTDG
jgi:Ca2+:H+ antiporter